MAYNAFDAERFVDEEMDDTRGGIELNILPVLEQLKEDPLLYARKRVANNLNQNGRGVAHMVIVLNKRAVVSGMMKQIKESCKVGNEQ